MQGGGDQLFARPVLALDEDVHVGRRRRADHVEQRAHLRIARDDPAELRHRIGRPTPRAAAGGAPATSAAAPRRPAFRHARRASGQRVHRHAHGRVAADDHDLRRLFTGAQARDQRDAVGVRKHELDSTRSGRHTRVRTSAVRASPAIPDVVAPAFEHRPKTIGTVGIIVGDQRSQRAFHGHGVPYPSQPVGPKEEHARSACEAPWGHR